MFKGQTTRLDQNLHSARFERQQPRFPAPDADLRRQTETGE